MCAGADPGMLEGGGDSRLKSRLFTKDSAVTAERTEFKIIIHR